MLKIICRFPKTRKVNIMLFASHPVDIYSQEQTIALFFDPVFVLGHSIVHWRFGDDNSTRVTNLLTQTHSQHGAVITIFKVGQPDNQRHHILHGSLES